MVFSLKQRSPLYTTSPGFTSYKILKFLDVFDIKGGGSQKSAHAFYIFQQLQTKFGSQEVDPCGWIPSLTSGGFGVLEFQVGFNLLVEIPGMENKSLSTTWAEAARAASKPHKAITFHMVSSLMAENIYYGWNRLMSC